MNGIELRASSVDEMTPGVFLFTRARSCAILLFTLAACSSPSHGASPCLPCHRAQVLGYEKNAMSRSFSHSVQQPSGSFTHQRSGSQFVIHSSEGAGQISLSRDGLSAAYPIAFVIGSGSHASGDIVRIGDYLFQAPITYLTSQRQWEMAPGYEESQAPDFTRPITAECLSCHVGRARLIGNTMNRFGPIRVEDEAIACDRCHGDTSAHLAHPAKETILNPKRLPQRARDSVCEQCHLMGYARILNPGKQFTDFRPGQELEQTYSVYVQNPAESRAGKGSIKVISHAEQLRQSMCARKSEGALWCGTCHNPHENPTDKVSYFRDRCLSCHGQKLLATHPKPADNCAGCHMPTRTATDGAHTVFTDHRISRIPAPDRADSDAGEPADLVAWREPAGPLALRNLGLANMELGESGNPAKLSLGSRQVMESAKSLPLDPVALTRIGVYLLQSGRFDEALGSLSDVVRAEPGNPAAHVNLAGVYRNSGKTEAAIRELKRAIELDPSLASAYRALVAIYTSQNDREAVARTLKLYLDFMPNNMMARKSLGQLESGNK